MQVLPLLSQNSENGFSAPSDKGILVSTLDYGVLMFENNTDQPLLVPCHLAYVVKQRAQDHAMAHLGVVKAHQRQVYKTAMCIQQNQIGYISPGQYELRMLPLPLRPPALAKQYERDFKKLWGEISSFNRSLGLQEMGHVEFFFHHFRRELNQFIAEFECIPKQVGAAVYIRGKLVGIERTPSHHYWQQVWQAILRDCYGSYTIYASKKWTQKMPNTRFPILVNNIASIEELEQKLQEANQNEQKAVENLLPMTEELPTTQEPTSPLPKLQIYTTSSPQNSWQGQILLQNNKIRYASLFRKNTF
ncbi:MAG: hypothetical protein D6805_06010 [Planctomycetota bacterium]|nr:MAG: hypothetical protein D6805_06010 [Planctomycetota bacterium]